METKKILWIEDEADQIKGLVRPLEKDGHEIIIAEDESKALETIEKSDFDLIICDIIMPTGVNGDMGDVSFVGMRLLKKLLIELEIKTPIIVLSVVRDTSMIDKMYEMGAKRVLQKGAFLPSKLRDEVYEMLDVRG